MAEEGNRNAHARHLRNVGGLRYYQGRLFAGVMGESQRQGAKLLAKPVLTLNRFKNFLTERSHRNSTIKKNIRSNIRYTWPEVNQRQRNITERIENTGIRQIYKKTTTSISNLTNVKYIFDNHLTPDQKSALLDSSDYTKSATERNKQFALFKSLLPREIPGYRDMPIDHDTAVKLLKYFVDLRYGKFHRGLVESVKPVKRKGRIVLGLAEIVFLFALDACIEKHRAGTIGEISLDCIQQNIDEQTSKFQLISSSNRKKINILAHNIKSHLKQEEDGSLSIKHRKEPIQFEKLLFDDGPEERTDLDRVRHIAHTGIGDMFGYRPYHHGIYLGGGYILEAWPQKIPETNDVTQYVSIKHLNDFIKFARNLCANFYMFPYTNPYPDRTLRQRALWTLGQYPGYDLMNENCESIPNWVFENNVEKPDLCIAPGVDVEAYESPVVYKFWGELLNETPEKCKERRDSYGPILQGGEEVENEENLLGYLPGEGGGRTRRRTRAKRKTQKQKRRAYS